MPTALDRKQMRKEIILALIPTGSYANLTGNAKDELIKHAEVFVQYIFDGKTEKTEK